MIVAAVPWARHGAGPTRAFDDQVARLATAHFEERNEMAAHVAARSVPQAAERID